MDDEQTRADGAGTSLKREVVTVVGSVLATLIATALIDQYSNLQLLLAQTVQLSVAMAGLWMLMLAFAAGAAGVVFVRRAAARERERAQAREETLRASLAAEAAAAGAGYEERIRRLTADLEALERQSAIDIVTGVYNRNQVPRFVEARVQKARAENTTFCLILADIDGFKGVNDTYDHEIGDRILRQVAELLTPRSKEDVLVRYGGDEFLIISRLGTDVGGGFGFASRLQREVANASFYAVSNEHVRITISCGVVGFHPAADADTLLKQAAVALHRAKAPPEAADGARAANGVYVLEPGQA